ncbi:hypothetical protein BsWGS_00915 [Bradybaena similaris]
MKHNPSHDLSVISSWPIVREIQKNSTKKAMRSVGTDVFTKSLSYSGHDESSCKMKDIYLMSLPKLPQNGSDEEQKEEKHDIILKKCSEDVHESSTTKTSSYVTEMSQSSIQISLPADYNQTEIKSSTQTITNTGSSSAGDQFSMASLNAATESQASGHTDSRSTGARPKLIATRTLKKNGRPKNKHKNVTWSEEKKCVTFIDDVTYDHYRNRILNLPLPKDSRIFAAVEAMLFMREKDEHISNSLIDIAVKFLWIKLGYCPKAVPLYTTISDFKYNEKALVLAFLELCQTEASLATANTLFGNIQTLILVPVNTNPSSQHSFDAVDSIPSHTFCSTPDKIPTCHSLTDIKSVINSGQQSSLVLTNEPLKALDFHIPQQVSQFQEILQPPCEANHSVPHIHHPASDTSNPASHSSHSVFDINNSISPIDRENFTKDSKTSRNQQRLPICKEQMRHLQIEALKKEQEYLKKTLTCVLCKNKPAEITLLPCGHFALCATCSDQCNICPVCKKVALAEVKTFLG